MFNGQEIQSSPECRIYKVPHYIRKWNEEAYTPQVISIGPFHCKNERLKATEKHKVRFFKDFMARSSIHWKCLVDARREMEESIRGCYAETIDLSSDGLVKMVLMDVSFILELFLRYREEDQNPLTGERKAAAVKLDLVILENQLPFFVIQKLYNLAFPSLSDYDGLLDLSLRYFSEFNIQHIDPMTM